MTHEPHDEQRLLRDFLAGRDMRCPTCGYNLRNTTGDCCPECGLRLKLSLGSTPKLGALACLYAAIAAPIGFAGTVAAPGWYHVIERLREPNAGPFYGWGRPDLMNLKITTAVFVVGLILLRICVWQARRFIGWPSALRWSAAALAIALSFGSIYALIRCYTEIYSLE